ncbi:hypothetical protein Mp_6g02920 [Marchantia polymorpha subsp. ruderalis]|uniref:Uncharacterized protein n=2 Tax=Marchantia polymorpha TaxID=3197 RepID=A0AAF6BMY0_MARPO|nr:hypothetical protein MARPO_0035s0078 [Marchantia polymorpha]BBN13364.1 hypothetical protein Mp_6g02920 [Marchantia polymorpha subsp. ruderalis]|eukprot:PTQ41296.1 hypothetical protein MARPO_0035s0078 [Marchantia polymorpha]
MSALCEVCSWTRCNLLTHCETGWFSGIHPYVCVYLILLLSHTSTAPQQVPYALELIVMGGDFLKLQENKLSLSWEPERLNIRTSS